MAYSQFCMMINDHRIMVLSYHNHDDHHEQSPQWLVHTGALSRGLDTGIWHGHLFLRTSPEDDSDDDHNDDDDHDDDYDHDDDDAYDDDHDDQDDLDDHEQGLDMA